MKIAKYEVSVNQNTIISNLYYLIYIFKKRRMYKIYCVSRSVKKRQIKNLRKLEEFVSDLLKALYFLYIKSVDLMDVQNKYTIVIL